MALKYMKTLVQIDLDFLFRKSAVWKHCKVQTRITDICLQSL